MVEYSILEYGVYGFITYSCVLMLIISTIKEVPVTKSMSIARALYMLLGVIFAFVLMGSGPTITLPTGAETFTYVINGSNGNMITNSTTTITTPAHITISNGVVWMTAHFMIGVFLILYVIQQFVMLFFKTDT